MSKPKLPLVRSSLTDKLFGRVKMGESFNKLLTTGTKGATLLSHSVETLPGFVTWTEDMYDLNGDGSNDLNVDVWRNKFGGINLEEITHYTNDGYFVATAPRFHGQLRVNSMFLAGGFSTVRFTDRNHDGKTDLQTNQDGDDGFDVTTHYYDNDFDGGRFDKTKTTVKAH